MISSLKLFFKINRKGVLLCSHSSLGWELAGVVHTTCGLHNAGEILRDYGWFAGMKLEPIKVNVECLFSADTKDPHEAVEIAIKNNSWG
jgi:hypothetical protein